jgi:hypothetical protein
MQSRLSPEMGSLIPLNTHPRWGVMPLRYDPGEAAHVIHARIAVADAGTLVEEKRPR